MATKVPTLQAPTARQLAAMPLADLTAANRNPKGHDLPGIGRAIAKFGYLDVIILDERTGNLVAGHGRVESLRAAEAAGGGPPDGIDVAVDGTWLVPVLRGWSSRSDEEAEAYLIASNRLTEKGGWDDYGLAEVLSDLAEANMLELTGYDAGDLEALEASLRGHDEDTGSAPEARTDPDDAPTVRAATISQIGDLWHLGPHRLVVGDATDAKLWTVLLGADHPDMVWTDPPYGVSYVGKTRDALTIENDTLGADGLDVLIRAVFARTLAATRPGACWYVASPPGPLTLAFGQALHDIEVLRQTLIWVKDQFVMGHSDYHYRHEPIYYGWTPGSAHQAVPDRTQDTVHEVSRPKRSKDHPTMKPVELIARHVENSTNPGDLVVDPFAGSGSTLIACHGARRRAALIELDPRYSDVILRRYQEHTGTVPTRNGTPISFVVDEDNAGR